jgi:hypothetical protein
LPHHNYQHIYFETLPESLRLDKRDKDNSSTDSRLRLIASVMVHDMWSHRPLDPRGGFKTKEERTAKLAEPLVLIFFNEADTQAIQADVISTAAGQPVTTSNQRKLRRADIANVGSKTATPFLATTVRLFDEEITLKLEEDLEPPLWTPFVKGQANILSQLAQQDLSMPGDRPAKRGSSLGWFNSILARNISMMQNKRTVFNPNYFVGSYGMHVRKLVPNFERIKPYILRTPSAEISLDA